MTSSSRSPGGSCELVRAANGWLALNLARPDDVAFLPAIESAAAGLFSAEDLPPSLSEDPTSIEDFAGAQAAGLRAYQVETGKFTARDLENLKINPDGRLAALANLPEILASL